MLRAAGDRGRHIRTSLPFSCPRPIQMDTNHIQNASDRWRCPNTNCTALRSRFIADKKCVQIVSGRHCSPMCCCPPSFGPPFVRACPGGRPIWSWRVRFGPRGQTDRPRTLQRGEYTVPSAATHRHNKFGEPMRGQHACPPA